jgi:hypothetical protein
VADADVTCELEHVLLLEHVAHQTGGLVRAEAALKGGHDAGRVLATMLQYGQGIVEPLVHRLGSDDADDAAPIGDEPR